MTLHCDVCGYTGSDETHTDANGNTCKEQAKPVEEATKTVVDPVAHGEGHAAGPIDEPASAGEQFVDTAVEAKSTTL